MSAIYESLLNRGFFIGQLSIDTGYLSGCHDII